MMLHESDISEEVRESQSATYCPEDNKIRIYCGRLERESYNFLRECGYKSTPKQDCAFVAVWSLKAEDAALALIAEADDIGDEDYSPEERAADRAERFSGYREKRRAEAGALADRFDAGPSAFGYQNQGRSERAAARHDRVRTGALSQWSKAEYWQRRTAGVIGHALYKSSASVRRGRIIRLEDERRHILKRANEYREVYELWVSIAGMEGADEVRKGPERKHWSAAYGVAYDLTNSRGGVRKYTHPRTGREAMLYSLLTDLEDPLTAREAADMWLHEKPVPGDPELAVTRWLSHYELRLNYERAMLAVDGGSVTDVEMEVGGFIGGHRIYKINKSSETGAVVSVTAMWPSRGGRGTGLAKRVINVQRMGENAYRPPTDEERASFDEEVKANKAKEKAAREKAPKLINPTMEDAQRLQEMWNAAAKEPNEVCVLTQAEYSAMSKGEYGRCSAIFVTEKGQEYNLHWSGERRKGWFKMFKVRKRSGGQFYGADRVVVLSDKPQKPIDWAAMQDAIETITSKADLVDQILELYRLSNVQFGRSEDDDRLLAEAEYHGLVQIGSTTQISLTAEGREHWTRANETRLAEGVTA